eukprot:11137210-Karenia_brevis.AAC.1
MLAAFTATEWSNLSSIYWQRVDGHWVMARTCRGDWQGRRKAMAQFCLSLKAALQSCTALQVAGVCTASIQDDTYLVGDA